MISRKRKSNLRNLIFSVIKLVFVLSIWLIISCILNIGLFKATQFNGELAYPYEYAENSIYTQELTCKAVPPSVLSNSFTNANITLTSGVMVSPELLIAIVTISMVLIIIAIIVSRSRNCSAKVEAKKYSEAFEKFKKCTFEFDIKSKKILLSPYAQTLLEAKCSIYKFDSLALEFDLSQKDIQSISRMTETFADNSFVEHTVYVEKIHKYLHIELFILSNKSSKKVTAVIGTIEDTTSSILTKRALAEKVKVDQLTKLLNSEAIVDIVNEQIQVKKESRSALLLIDIDDFKSVNEEYGHYVGDLLLQKFAKTLETLAKKNHLYAFRQAGDEFGLYIPSFLTLQDIREIASQICLEIEDFSISSRNIKEISISIGISLYPSHADTYQKLFQCADNALYNSKKATGSRITFYDTMEANASFEPADRQKLYEIEESFSRIVSQTGGELKIRKILNEALKNEEIKIYLQPKVSVKTDEVECEVLARWQSREYGLVMPAQFLPMFEFAKLMPELDRYILEKSFQFIAENKGNNQIKISINQSLEAITSPQYANSVSLLAKKYAIPEGVVTIELTERCMFISLRSISKVITILHELGFRVSIDDFGTGFTTLNIIKDLDVDEIKIDKTFINIDDEKSITIVTKLCQMASKLNLITVAEGVGTFEQMKFLTQVGCDFLQGFYFSKAVTTDGFIKDYTSGEYLAKKYI